MEKRSNWFSLDNAAKIFPAITAKNRSNSFAVGAVLSEDVNPDILQKAVSEILDRFPAFKVKLKKGFFWYYFDENNNPVSVFKEEPFFLKKITEEKDNNKYLFRVYYYKNRITISFFHVLTDGMGATEFLKSIIYEYLKLSDKKIKSDGKVIINGTPVTEKEVTDNFLTYSNDKNDKPEKDPKAFKLSGTPFGYDGVSIIMGKLKGTQLKEVTKQKGVTVTCFLTAVIMHSIYNAFIKGKKVSNKIVTTLISVNLRKWFPSKTLRNFVMYIRVKHDFEKEVTLDDLIELSRDQMEEKLTKENLVRQMTANVKIEKNWFLRIQPLFIKDIALRIGYDRLGDKLHTISFSNLGVIEIPEGMKKYIKEIFLLQGVSESAKCNISSCTCGDNVNISFARLFVENDFEREFFRTLSSLGLDIEVVSNCWECAL